MAQYRGKRLQTQPLCPGKEVAVPRRKEMDRRRQNGEVEKQMLELKKGEARLRRDGAPHRRGELVIECLLPKSCLCKGNCIWLLFESQTNWQ